MQRKLLVCLGLGTLIALAASFLAGTVTAAEPGRAAAQADNQLGEQVRLGEQVENFTLADYRGKSWSLTDFKSSKLVVVAFVGTECPLVAQYAARLQELSAEYGAEQVAFVAIDSNQQDSLAEIANFARVQKIEFPILRDSGNKVADKLRAERTPEVFVLDASRKIRYHGRIDDQFTYGRRKPQVEKQYLVAAIDELLAGKAVTLPAADAVGCHIGRVLSPKADSPITYSKQISRIFQKRCVECHRPGEIAPFALESYEDAVGWAAMIREVVQEQRMPPWHANPKYGHFINDARLTDTEKQQIYAWVDAGAPEGDKADLPAPRQFTSGWQIGEPDQVVYISDKPFKVPATGEVRYQYFLVDPGFTKDTWVQAAECRPGNRAVVHHIIVGVQPPGALGKNAREFEGVHSEWLTATAPGGRPLILGTGLAKLIPAGSKLVFQMHYTPNGTATEDRSCVGLKFVEEKEVHKVVGTDKASNNKFQIPPGDNNYKVEATHTFKRDMLMLAMFPHMHLRGKAFRYTAIYPDGKQEVLLDVPHYDFNWQNAYAFAEPKRIPAGSKLFCEAWFDNSRENLANPDPTTEVRWGDQTWEEMMIGYFDATPADQDLRQQATAQSSRTSGFVERAVAGKVVLSDELKSLARHALDSTKQLEKFGLALRKVLPQLDRCCFTVVDGGKLEIKYCVQEPSLERVVGGAGRKVDAAWSAVASYASQKEPISNPVLSEARGIDLRFMARAYGSSIHFPVRHDKLAGSLNFWSAEPHAFPPEAAKVLAEAVRLMTAEK
jgi:peroxiredoxin